MTFKKEAIEPLNGILFEFILSKNKNESYQVEKMIDLNVIIKNPIHKICPNFYGNDTKISFTNDSNYSTSVSKLESIPIEGQVGIQFFWNEPSKRQRIY